MVSGEAKSESWPTEIRLAGDRRRLVVSYEDGLRHELAAELLRVESPSAEVQGHGPGEKQLVTGKADVRIASVEPIGNYAVRLVFDDGHSTGIYGWSYLRQLGDTADALMRRYREAVTSRRAAPPG